MDEKELLKRLRNKRVTKLSRSCCMADLKAQEFDIMKLASCCNSLETLEQFVDKCMDYIGMANSMIK